MNTKDNGGPAFPDVQFTHNNGDTSFKNNGMSLRDWFAGQALIGLVNGRQERVKTFAFEAYAVADAMLAERSKEDAK